MAWKRILINFALFASLVIAEVTAAFLGGSFNNPTYLILCLGLLVSAIFNITIVNFWLSAKDEQEILNKSILDFEKKVSTLSIQNNQTGNNFFHVAIRPVLANGTYLTINNRYELCIYVNSPYEIPRKPDIKLVTQKPWRIFCTPGAPEVSPSTHNDKFEYSLKGCLNPIIIDKKFYLYRFFVEFTEFAENDFTFLVESRDYKSEINNTIFIRSA